MTKYVSHCSIKSQFTDDRTTQCEALKPETLKRILLSAIHRYVDAISTLKQLGFSG